jgi:hypothetical protein
VVVEPGLVVGELVVGQDAGGGPSVFLAGPPVVRAVHRGGLAVAEDVDHALRLAFFRDSVDVSIAAGLRRALGIAAGLNKDIDVDAVIALWTDSPVRTDVAADFRDSRQLPTGEARRSSGPTAAPPVTPGMTDHYWRGGLMRINSADPGEPERLLRKFAEQRRRRR